MSSLKVYNKDVVKCGAQLLDKLVPGWHKRIDLERLNMVDINLCILGQLFGYEVELALGKELYPDLWEKYNGLAYCGYGIGLYLLGEVTNACYGNNLYHLNAATEETDAYFLTKACAGGIDKCVWAEEIAERLAKDNNDE